MWIWPFSLGMNLYKIGWGGARESRWWQAVLKVKGSASEAMRHHRASWFSERIQNPLGSILCSSISVHVSLTSVLLYWTEIYFWISLSSCLQGRSYIRIPISSGPTVLCFCNPQFLTLSKSWSVECLQAQGNTLYARRSSKAGVKLSPKDPKLWPLLPSSRPAHPGCKSHSGHMQKGFKKL